MLRLERGDFGFVDTANGRLRGNQKLTCELTIKGGRVLYDLNGLTSDDWEKLPAPRSDSRPVPSRDRQGAAAQPLAYSRGELTP